MLEKIGEFETLLKKSKKILLVNHIRMDPDAFGSLTGFYLILQKLGYEVKATNDDQTPADFDFLGVSNIIEPNINISEYNPDLIISFDAASLGQLGETYKESENIFNNTPFVVIDHHITNPGFGSLNIINTQSSSTCELVFHILEIFGFESHIDSTIATLLTAGMLTDTNMYYNTNTTVKTLETASKLLSYGADFRSPIFNFFKKKTYNKTKLWGEVLKDLQQSDDSKIVWVKITKDIFKKTNTTDKATSGLINEFLSNMEGMEVSFLLYELDKGGVKASFRSSKINVGEFCESFGGGGHKQAAGFTLFEDIDIIEEKILSKLKELL